MAYSANQYNYATPLSSAAGIGRDTPVVDLKYFTLADNVLDGSCHPIEGDVGLWGNALSDANGILQEPFVVTYTGELTVNAFRLRGSQHCYPVDFVVEFFNGDQLAYHIAETHNEKVDYISYLPSTIATTGYRVTIDRISAPNHPVQLIKAYNPWHVKRSDTVTLDTTCECVASELISKASADSLLLVDAYATHITNRIDPTKDTLVVNGASDGKLTNVHTRMKDPSRRIYGKVYITYTDPMLSVETNVQASSNAHNSEPVQLLDGSNVVGGKFFTLYENDLTGAYTVSDPYSQVGWTSGVVSDANGNFADPAPFVRINFAERPVVGLPITFDDSHGVVAKDFSVEFVRADGTSLLKTFTDNDQKTVVIPDSVANVVAIVITVTRINKSGYPVTILEVPVVSTVLYVGYADRSDLVSIDMLEELTYDDDVEALGGVSANKVTVSLDNSNREFFFNNPNSLVAASLRRNRKIVPWLGVEIKPGEIEWHTLGTYWSYNWDVPVEGLVAKVIGFDTIGLLDTTSFTDHQVLQDKSIGQLLEYVLDDAKTQLDFITYRIDPALYDIVVPFAWFEPKSHTAALRRISGCYPMHIYCDRNGVICAAPQKLKMDYYYDVWSDSTNVISKRYQSLFTTLPNIINVTFKSPVVLPDEELVNDEFAFRVDGFAERTFNFNKPCVSDLEVLVNCDESIECIYSAYSWGIEFSFSGVGEVRSIRCVGKALDTSRTMTLSRRDARSVRLNGAVTRDISHDFIQTHALADELIRRIQSLSALDKYDATVDYRGDIALSINDPILLLNGIAPDNRYNIKRHELFWNGALSGSAYLNT